MVSAKLIPALFLAATFSTVSGQTGPQIVGGVWSGNVSPTAGTVTVRLNTTGVRVRLQVSQNENLTPAVFSAAATTAAASGNTVKLTVQGLQPDTDYYYGIEVAGVLRTETVSRGRFRTFPLGKSSFRVALGSCGDFRAPDQRVYEAIASERPLLFINLGDLHYSDTNSTVTEDYRVNYDNVLSHREQGALYRSMAMAYVWDDHDFSGNDSDTTSAGRDAARAAYRERVPHYPLTTGGSVGQAFTIGRVRFIITDQRSASTPAAARDNASKTKLGTAQKAWFKQELISARDSGFPLIVWVCPDPWIGVATAGEDTWAGYTTERTELANFIRDNRINNVVIVSGDMHGLAVDDGTNSDYATGGGAPLTVLHAAALTSNGSLKGGPYSGGVLPGTQQYGILEVYDNGGDSVACRFLGKRVGEGAKLTHIFSGSVAGAAKDHAIANISTLSRVTSGEDALVSGFVISGASNRRVLIRAIGPTLAAFGVGDALAQPVLSVHQAGRPIASNTGWAGATAAATEATLDAFDRAGAFRLADQNSRDAALVLSLAPGAYTVQVKSADGAPGATLLEVYDLP
jgi:phosphodiesterase/alkaline phosphatase D-like protein